MSPRPRLLDLFCCAGGASAGYHAAGFDVTGVDIAPQPYYPFPFIQADALTVDLSGYDVVAASPPCQRYSTATPTSRRDDHPDLVDPIRQRLRDAVADGLIWGYVIENVPGAPLHNPITICGDTLRLGVRRHRLFESNLDLHGTRCHHDRSTPAVPVYGSYGQRGTRNPAGWEASRNPVDFDTETSPGTPTEAARAAMGIDWMPWPNLTQAIPPAYTFWIGTQLIGHARHHRPVTQATRAQTSPADATHRREPSPGDASPAAVTHPPRSTPDQPGELRGSVTTRTCHCGKPLARPTTGRWPRHCSHACRQAAYRARTKKDAA
ncbi:DNA cytosine methyltransferase [Saccharothrix texasensis]|uniref:DNA (Cytosine-5)-methyltransferase 1 n=1 Tax=Saccharothrix texasensis TaxID=103734 RepID=A0A3N1H9J2_9PSEU|nr:DNA cytosine methyltransferase [Saccharothrix texasensis]ROP39111.1 DNA (cytosine-5)-methyltransferase 1 [Saccharothrix texasensis]